MLQDGSLALRHETGGRFGELLGIQRFGGVGGVGLTQRIRTVVKPSIGVGIDVGVVAVGQKVPADVVHGQGEVPASVVNVAVRTTNPVRSVIGHNLGPACC